MIWIFGDSLSTAHNMSNETAGWPYLLSKRLGKPYKNFAQRSADNFFIYSSYYENLESIQEDDIVIIGWSHYNRKSFVLDRDNPIHIDNIEDSSIFKVRDKEFIRSRNPVTDNRSKMLSLLPRVTGKTFYDTWFKSYYSEYEQLRHLQSYQDSVKLTCPGKYCSFEFTDVLDWINDNDVAISQNDQHFNEEGHQKWAEKIYKELNNVSRD